MVHGTKEHHHFIVFYLCSSEFVPIHAAESIIENYYPWIWCKFSFSKHRKKKEI